MPPRLRVFSEAIEVCADDGDRGRCDAGDALRLTERFRARLGEPLNHLAREAWNLLEWERLGNATSLRLCCTRYGLLLTKEIAFVLDGGFNRGDVEHPVGFG